VRQHFATFSNPKLEGIAKVRTMQPMETLKLPTEAAWATLQAAYDAANAPR
jgi:tellurite resistance protein